MIRLEYEAYETMAIKEMYKIYAAIFQKWEGVKHVLIWHRTGVVEVKKASVVIVVSSSHRRSSLEATSWAIDELKKNVTIWKREIYEDGSEWKQNPEFLEAHINIQGKKE